MTLSVIACIVFLSIESRTLVEERSAQELVKQVQEFAEEIEWEDGALEFDEDFELYHDGIYFSAYDQRGNLIYGWQPDCFVLEASLSRARSRASRVRVNLGMPMPSIMRPQVIRASCSSSPSLIRRVRGRFTTSSKCCRLHFCRSFCWWRHSAAI